MSREIKAKRECCHSGPRCKSCPVVLKRLEKAGLAERLSKRTYAVAKPSASALKTARAR